MDAIRSCPLNTPKSATLLPQPFVRPVRCRVKCLRLAVCGGQEGSVSKRSAVWVAMIHSRPHGNPRGFPCAGEREGKLLILLSQHFVMSNYPGSRRGSAPPPYTFGASPSIPSPARILHHRNPGYNHLPPPNTPDRRQYGSEPASLSHSEGTRRRRGVIPLYGTGGQADLQRPSRVFSDYRPSLGSLYKPPETRLSYSPPQYESDPAGIDKFKDEDDINFNILRKYQRQFSPAPTRLMIFRRAGP